MMILDACRGILNSFLSLFEAQNIIIMYLIELILVLLIYLTVKQ